jgi:16S rRNA processing protein RimM
MTPAEEWTWLARIRRPQGRKGEVFADILTDFPERFSERRNLWLIPDSESIRSESQRPESPRTKTNPASIATELIHHWPHKGGMVLHFAGVNSISDAELLAGKILAIPLAERAPLPDDEVYIADLIGCALFDVAGPEPILVGQIEAVDRTAGPVALLVIDGPAGEVLVPFAKSYLRNLDLAAKRVEMALPEGLTDLNTKEKP